MSDADFAPEQMPYNMFKITWMAIQKALSVEDAKKVFPQLGKELAEQFPVDNVTDADSLASALKAFLEEGFGMVTSVDIENDGHTLSFHNNGCYFCPANTALKHEGKVPTCIFPPLVLNILQRARKEAPALGLKNLKFGESQKPGPVGECIMTFNIG
jgi:hypothetical protein